MAVTMRTRDDVIRELTRHCGDGRLTLDELEERIQEAQDATTEAELLQVLRELPRTTVDEPIVTEPEPPPEPPEPPVISLGTRRAVEAVDRHEWEKSVGTLCCIGGFVLLFNGMFWLALVCWFVLPGLVIKHRSR